MSPSPENADYPYSNEKAGEFQEPDGIISFSLQPEIMERRSSGFAPSDWK